MKSTTQVLNEVDITEKILHYWINHHVIEPADPHFGSGRRHKWSEENILTLKILAKLNRQFDELKILERARVAISQREPLDELLILDNGLCFTCSYESALEIAKSGRVVTAIRLDQI